MNPVDLTVIGFLIGILTLLIYNSVRTSVLWFYLKKFRRFIHLIHKNYNRINELSEKIHRLEEKFENIDKRLSKIEKILDELNNNFKNSKHGECR